MNERLNQFLSPFLSLKKEECFQLVDKWKMESDFSVLSCINDVLVPAMNHIPCDTGSYNIWQEHVMTAIVHSLLDYLYLDIVKYGKAHYEDTRKVAVITPSGENHAVGSKVASAYFNMLGFDAYYIGLDTPRTVLEDMISKLGIDILAISITNVYHLTELQKVVSSLRASDINIPIVVGGYAFKHKHQANQLGENVYLKQTFEELKDWLDGGKSK